MVVSQGSRGKIELFSDFAGPEHGVTTATAGPVNFPPFVLFGDGLNETDSGVVTQTTLLGGVIRLTTTNEDNHYCKVGCSPMLDVALMSPLVIEARVQMAALTTRRCFVGFSNLGDTTSAVEFEANSGTVTNTATSFVGFLFDSGATLSTSWLYGYNGGTTAALVTEQDTGKDPVAGEWDVLRVEVFDNGDTRFFINGEYITQIDGAVSTTTDLNAYVAAGGTGAAVATVDVDYLYISASRDWTR